jgi:cell division septum initiation protein DivIVA
MDTKTSTSSDGYYKKHIERLQQDNKQLKQRLDVLEKENKELKKSLYDISIRFLQI